MSTRPRARTRLIVLVSASTLAGALLSACGSDEPAPTATAEASNTTLVGTLVARQWACVGDSAQSVDDRLGRLFDANGPKMDSATTAAMANTVDEIFDAMRDGLPTTDHSSETLAAADPVGDEGYTEECDNAGDMFGYADLGDGTQVDITDGAGETLSLAKLENGRITIHGTIWDFTAQVSDSDFYEVAVADRGSVKVDGAAAAAPIALQLR